MPQRYVVGLRDVVPVSGLAALFARTMPAVASEFAEAGLTPEGARWRCTASSTRGVFEVTVGFPVDASTASSRSLVGVTLPGGPAVQALHCGSYDSLAVTYAELARSLAARDIEPPATVWEEYLVGPDSTDDPAGWCTRVVFPLP